MNIRSKITLSFFTLVAFVLTCIMLSIYFFSAEYRQKDFHRRLKNRAINTAKVLIEVEEVNADLLRRMEQNNPASLPNQYIVIYNYKNEVLYSSDRSNVIPFDTALINDIRLQNEVRFEYNNYEAVGFLFAERYDRFTVIGAATDVYGLDALRNLRNVLIVTFLISLILVSIIGWIYAGKVLSPINKIVSDVGKISAANLDQRLHEQNTMDELGRLAATFNKMLERLSSSFSAQKNFIANASHEIKTPITIMSSEIEVSLLQDRDGDYYKKTLKSVLGGLKALNRLSTQLLLLAQTSADEPRRNFSPIRIDDIIWEMKEELQKVSPHYKVDIDFSIEVDHDSLQIQGDEQLMKVAIMNLIDNGCKYSDDNHVSVNLNAYSNKIKIEFVNNGQGIDADIILRIFDPFFRGKQSKKAKGFGIGLSLVNRIIKLHDGEIHVESVPHQKTKFTLLLPVT